MTAAPVARLDAERRRAELLALAADARRYAPADYADSRRWFTGRVLALAADVTAADLDALSYAQLSEVGALLAAAVASRPDPDPAPQPT